MKTQLFSVLNFVVLLMLANSCEKEQPVTPPTPEPSEEVTVIDTISCSTNRVTIPIVGGDTTLQVIAKDNWKAEYNSSWVTISPKEATGAKAISVNLLRNGFCQK